MTTPFTPTGFQGGATQGNQTPAPFTPTTPHPQAVKIAKFIDNLHSAGLGGLHPEIQVALANGPIDHPQMMDVIKTIKSAASQVKPFVSTVFHDPALLDKPTVAQKIAWRLYQNGIPAQPEQDIKTTQATLIRNGYAQGLSADGVWTPDWNSALYDHTNAEMQKPGVGNVSAKDVVLKVFGMGLPSHFIPYFESILVQTLHHAADAAAFTISRDPLGLQGHGQPTIGDHIGAALTSLNNITEHKGSVSPEEFMKTPRGISDYVNVVGTVATIWGLTGAVKAGATAIARGATATKEVGVFGDLGKDAVAPKLTILNSILPKTEGVIKGGAQARRFRIPFIGRSLANRAANSGGLLSAATRQLPSALGDSWATMRTIAAQPLRNPLIALGSDLGSTASLLGLKTGLIGGAENLLGGGSQATDQANIHPWVGLGATIADWATLGLHPASFNPSVPSARFGAAVSRTQNKLIDFLDQHDTIGIWERSTGGNFKHAVSDLKDLAQEKGNMAVFYNAENIVRSSIFNNIRQFAVSKAAKDFVNEEERGGKAFTPQERQNAIEKYSAQINGDKQQVLNAVDDIQNTNGALQGEWGTSMLQHLGDAKYDARKSYAANLYSDHLMSKAMPLSHHFITPYTTEAISERNLLKEEGRSQQISLAKEKVAKTTIELQKAEHDALAVGLDITDMMKNAGEKMKDPEIKKIQLALNKAKNNSAEAKTQLSNLDTPKKNDFVPLDDNSRLAQFGKMRLDNQSKQNIQAKAYTLGKELEKVDPFFNVENLGQTLGTKLAEGEFTSANASKVELDIRDEAFHYMREQLGLDTQDMRFWTTEDLLSKIQSEADKYASEVSLPFDAPQVLHDLVAEMKTMGYRPVFGRDIGHGYLAPVIDVNELGHGQNALQKFFSRKGLNFTPVDPSTSASIVNTSMLRYLQEKMNSYKIGTIPPGSNATTLINYLRKTVVQSTDPGLYAQFSVAYAAGQFSKEAEAIRKEFPDLGSIEVMAKVYKGIEKTTGPWDWRLKQVVDALTKPNHEVVNLVGGGKVLGAGMSHDAAVQFYYDMTKALTKTPADIVGLKNPLTLLLTKQIGVTGKHAYWIASRLPTTTAEIRKALIRYRYQGNPEFAYKRIIKTGIKGATEGVPFTWNAEKTMADMGLRNHYMEIRAKVLPDAALNDVRTDEIEQIFLKNDIYNIFQPREIEAYTIGTLYDNALAKFGGDASKIDPKQIRADFEKIYSYGNRTAAEKSVNAFFFPFSFEKTVMRQLGGSLLDSPAQRLLTLQAVNMYDSIGGEKIKVWMEKNLPLFKEAEKFNPFSHGIGLGQFGGIDRLYFDVAKATFVNWLAPRAISDGKGASAVMNLIPAFRELNDLFFGVDPYGKKPTQPGGQVGATAKMTAWEIGNKTVQVMNFLRGKGFKSNTEGNPFTPQTHKTFAEQQDEGWNFRTLMVTAYSDYLKANELGHEYVFPDSIPDATGLRGKKVTKANIDTIVNYVYPQWDKNQGVTSVLKRNATSDVIRGHLTTVHPDLIPYYDMFIKNANSISGKLSKPEYTTANMASDTQVMRQSAIYLSYFDRNFYDFYKKYYQSKFGPLEVLGG